MAISHVVSGTGGIGTTSWSDTVSAANVQENDVIFVFNANEGSTADPSISDDSGDGNSWTRIGAGGLNGSVWWKRISGGNWGSSDVTITSSGNTNVCAGNWSNYRGVIESGDPYTDASFESNASGNESHAGFTPSFADSMLVGSVINYVIGNTTQNQTFGATAATEAFDSGADVRCSSSFLLQVGNPAATGDFTWTQGNQLTISVLFAIRPFVSPPATGGFGGGNQTWGEAPWGAEPVAEDGGSVSMPADSGTYTITGTAMGPDISMPADAGTYNITGSAINFDVKIPIGGGSYSIVGTAVGLLKNGKLTADAGSYLITGTPLTFDVKTPIDPGTYQITGTAVGLLANRKIAIDSGTYSLTGSDVALAKGRTLEAEVGSYLITGTDANFHVNMPAAPGSYSLTGTAVGLLKGRTITADSGTYSITGTELSLEPTREVGADGGTYSITGSAINFDVKIPIGAGSYSIVGTAVDFILGGNKSLAVESGSYIITGSDVNLVNSAARRRGGGVSPANLKRAWQIYEEEIVEILLG